MQYHFNDKIARKFGVNVAIFLDNMAYWHNRNMANNKHFHDGRFWTYNTVDAFSVLFSFWTPRQIRKIIDDCVKYGLIISGNYNSTQYDRTKWYSLTDEAMELLDLPICQKRQMKVTNKTNESDKKVKPIPDNKPDIKQERATPRKKREALPDDFRINSENHRICLQRNLDPEHVMAKFMAKKKSQGAMSADWQEEAKAWILSERQDLKKQEPSTEQRSIVPDHQYAYNDIKQASTSVVNENMSKIKQLLSRKMINGAQERKGESRATR